MPSRCANTDRPGWPHVAITVPISVNPGPNTTVNVLGIKLILNEQIATGTATDHTLTVNAVHVIVPGLLDTVVASSTSDIHGCA